jgi:hypothetical protein
VTPRAEAKQNFKLITSASLEDVVLDDVELDDRVEAVDVVPLVILCDSVCCDAAAEDRVEVTMGSPNTSVVGDGSVVIWAVGTVISVVATPCAVSAHRHHGVSVGMKSPVVVSPNDALVYVTRYNCAFPVFVAARDASGVAVPSAHSL